VNRTDSPADHVTPYDRFAWSDTVVEHLLASGEHPRELTAYFGASEYEALVALAREAQKVPVSADAPRVYIVPGIMGSQLGRMRRAPLPNDILWLDPVDISLGQLALLRLPVAGSPPVAIEEHKHAPMQGEPVSPQETQIVSLGVVLFTYLRLKLHLRIAGFAPAFHDYDWRLGIDELGRGLAERLRGERARTMVVAHSMGGLVSRAAMSHPGLEHVERVVLLGTPNTGSFAPVLALRGVYAVVRKIARLSQSQTAESLAADVFSTFPSLYHLLPTSTGDSGPDFFDAAAWPAKGPQPKGPLLSRAREVLGALARGDERFVNIIGAGQETVTRATRKNGEFVYTITRQGDGTVPVAYAELPGARTYYTKVAHSDLARDAVVAQAIAEVLRTGATTRLDGKWSNNGKAEARISDTQLRRTHTGKVDFAHMEPEARQVFLRNLNDPPQLKLSVPGATKPATKARAAVTAQTAGKARTAAKSRASTTSTRASGAQAGAKSQRTANARAAPRAQAGRKPSHAKRALAKRVPAKRVPAKRVPAKTPAAKKASSSKSSLRKPRAAPRVARPSRRRPRKRVTSRR
jgi:pimeloyl-ACP methyl ester carboxylesterase